MPPQSEIPVLDDVAYKVEDDYVVGLRRQVAALMNVNHERFPGAQPVSFAQFHLDALERDNYFVSEKADGVRCLLFMNRREDGAFETFLVDRKNHYYFVDNLRFPIPGDPFAEQFHFDTILDGELVLDIDGDNRSLRFLLFDCVVLDRDNLMGRTFDKRLGKLREFILKPHDAYLATHPDYAANIPFTVELKELQLSYHLWKVMEQQPLLKHGSDGLLFTARDAPYISGQNEQMIKWKPSEENTADFKLRYTKEPYEHFVLQIQGRGNKDLDHCPLALDSEMEESWLSEPSKYHGRIVECRYDPEWPDNWRFARFRDDKDTANFVDVLKSIMRSIEDNVSKEELLARQDRIRAAWKHREAMEREMRARGPPPGWQQGPPQGYGPPHGYGAPPGYGPPPGQFGGPPGQFGPPPGQFGAPPGQFGGPPPQRTYGQQFEAPRFDGPPGPPGYGRPPGPPGFGGPPGPPGFGGPPGYGPPGYPGPPPNQFMQQGPTTARPPFGQQPPFGTPPFNPDLVPFNPDSVPFNPDGGDSREEARFPRYSTPSPPYNPTKAHSFRVSEAFRAPEAVGPSLEPSNTTLRDEPRVLAKPETNGADSHHGTIPHQETVQPQPPLDMGLLSAASSAKRTIVKRRPREEDEVAPDDQTAEAGDEDGNKKRKKK